MELHSFFFFKKYGLFETTYNILHHAKGNTQQQKIIKMLPRSPNQWFNYLKREISVSKYMSQFRVKGDKGLVYQTVLCFENISLSFPSFPFGLCISTPVAKELVCIRDQISSL